ncbi:MAG TPA: hypothetical protein VIH99_03095 [Bdellovibrionota bacterium]|jgi:hypothetical protein
MPAKTLLPWIAFGILLGTLCFLLTAYAAGRQFPSLYGTPLHSFGRFHVFFVHLGLGCVLLLPLTEFFLARKRIAVKPRAPTAWPHWAAHFTILTSLVTGLIAELIERYPNDRIPAHAFAALCCYLALVLLSALSVQVRYGKARMAMALLLFSLAVTAGGLGGLVYKGERYFSVGR